MHTLLNTILRLLAQGVIKKYKPRVIGITGSVGKSSTKDAIVTVLSGVHTVRATYKNYNNELGVPLTILGCESGGRNPFAWLAVIIKGLRLLVAPATYPEVLVLEMGADKPGDIGYLTDIAPVDIGILTAVSEAHLHEFRTIEGVLKEKEKIITKMRTGRAILNIDDANVKSVLDRCRVNVFTVGITPECDFNALEVAMIGRDEENCTDTTGWRCTTWGTGFKIRYNGSVVPFFLPGVIGMPNVYAALCATAVGIEMKMNLLEISENLRKYAAPAGRMRILEGSKGSLIIDDTYNSSPRAVIELLKATALIEKKPEAKTYAFLGDMLELGDEEVSLHQDIGRRVVDAGVNVLICVGPLAQHIGKSAQKAGMNPESIHYFETSAEVGNHFEPQIQPDDVIIIKGSQGARMERITKELMADALHAGELLVRQEWKDA